MDSIYNFNPHSIPVFFTATLTVILGITALIRNFKSIVNRYFFCLCFSIFIWLTATGIGYMSVSEELAEFWFKIDNFGVMFIAPSFFALTVHLTEKKLKVYIILGFLIASIFGVLGIFFSYFISGVKLYFWGYFPQWKFLNSIPFFLFWSVYSTASFEILKRAKKNLNSSLKINQIRFIILGFSIAYLASIDFFATFGISIYPLGFLPIFSLVICIAYAIHKYGLMDFNLTSRFWLIYLVITFIFSTPILIILKFINQSFLFFFIVPSLVFTFILLFKKLEPVLTNWVDHLPAFRQYLNREELVEVASREIANAPTIRICAEKSVNFFMRIMPIQSAIFLLYDPEQSAHVAIFSRGVDAMQEITARMQQTSILVSHAQETRSLISRDKILHQLESARLENQNNKTHIQFLELLLKELTDKKIEVLLPVFAKDDLLGFACFGQKRDGIYNDKDFWTIGIIAGVMQTVMGSFSNDTQLLQHTHSWIHDLISPFRKGGMMQMLDSTLKQKLPEKVLKDLSFLKNQLEFIERGLTEISQPTENLKLTLNLSPITLETLFLETEFMYADDLKQRNISFFTDKITTDYVLNIDRSLVTNRCICNLINNASRFVPKENGQIHLGFLPPENGSKKIKIFVRDNGLGIDSKIKEKIFEPRVKGEGKSGGLYGLGMTIFKQVIELHGGEVEVESQPGQGATFYFSLPLM